MKKYNLQQSYWLKEKDYIDRNLNFNNKIGKKIWLKLLAKKKINSVLECGANIGRNLVQINSAYPKKKLSFIEPNKKAFDLCSRNKQIFEKYNCFIEDCNTGGKTFDLVFTSGVLIHVNDITLKKIIKKIINFSRKYIIIIEYFSQESVMKKYRGKRNLLFLRDYGLEFLKTKKLDLIDCGFLYSFFYKEAGFDNMTYFIFKKK